MPFWDFSNHCSHLHLLILNRKCPRTTRCQLNYQRDHWQWVRIAFGGALLCLWVKAHHTTYIWSSCCVTVRVYLTAGIWNALHIPHGMLNGGIVILKAGSVTNTLCYFVGHRFLECWWSLSVIQVVVVLSALTWADFFQFPDAIHLCSKRLLTAN